MWLDEDGMESPARPGFGGPQPVDVFVTRLHVRYDADTFPEDLTFQVTGDRENYQGRYVLRHPWRGDFNQCEEAREYANRLVDRWEGEASNLAKLTGWDEDEIKEKMAAGGYSEASINIDLEPQGKKPWWQRLWGNG